MVLYTLAFFDASKAFNNITTTLCLEIYLMKYTDCVPEIILQ